jgi:hypothetical protein
VRRVSLAAVLIAALFIGSLALAGRAYAFAHDEWSASPTEPAPDGVYVTGDSLTYWGAPDLHRLRPTWQIEGAPGRWVQDLRQQVEEILAADPSPRVMVLALGTNTAYYQDYKALYAGALGVIPSSTFVVFVSTYRDPKIYARGSAWDDNMLAYHQWHESKAMRELAVERPRTCVAPWRSLAIRHRDMVDENGIHATRDKGRDAWARLVSRSVKKCVVAAHG